MPDLAGSIGEFIGAGADPISSEEARAVADSMYEFDPPARRSGSRRGWALALSSIAVAAVGSGLILGLSFTPEGVHPDT